MLAIAIVATLNVVLGSKSVFAQGEHTRRAATEIRVIIGDIRRLQAPDTLPIQIVGLKHRIQGGLAALDILLRLADQESGNSISQYNKEVNELTEWIENNEYAKALSLLGQWEARYPLTLLERNLESNADHKLARKLHQELCAACHDNPSVEVERPAYNLFNEAKTLTYSEFLARLFLGVRGDRVTGIDNPLSDYEISALVSYYASEK